MLYETEEQRIDAIRLWWRENGKSIIAGIVIGLGSVFGWRAWSEHRDQVGGQASNVFEQLVIAVEKDDAAVTANQARTLRQEFSATPYAAFADLMEARQRYTQRDAAGARTALEQAINALHDPGLQAIAVLRLARLQVSNGELDDATALLADHPPPSAFAADYTALRGDLARARGNMSAARAAYQEALAQSVSNADWVQLKLDNLPPTS